MQATAIPSDQIEATLEGRQFGTGVITDDTFQQEVPEALRVLRIQLQRQSQLLALDAANCLEKRQVYDAYRHDLRLLKGRVDSFERCVKDAIRASIVTGKAMEWNARESQTDKLWKQLNSEIPPMGRRPLLLLDHMLAAQPADDILSTLRDRFEHGIDQVLCLITCWLHLLVEYEMVGLVEWTDYDVARYHYFVHDQKQETLKDEQHQEVDVDESQPMGERTTYTTVRDKTVRTRRYLERHVHHIVDVKVHDLEVYSDRVPARVAKFLNSVPDWLRPLLQVVSGEITTEEIVRRKSHDETTVESTIESVTKGSPAVTLGNFALAGWSSDDVRGDNAKFYRCQDERTKERRRILRKAVWVTPACILAIAALVWLIMLGVGNYEASRQYQLDTYIANLGDVTICTTGQGNSIALLGEKVPIVFTGIRLHSDDVSLARYDNPGDEEASLYRTFQLSNRNYGDIDLGPEFGVLARLHIVSVTKARSQRNPDVIRYAVTYYGENAPSDKANVQTP